MPSPSAARVLAQLTAQGLLPPAQAAAIAEAERTRPFSLHYELRAVLYLGITLLSGGLGVLVYQNIDRIGHGFIIAAVALLMAACFVYAARHRPPFTWDAAPRTSVGADYLLLLGCLLSLVLEGYLQYQYNIFGTRYGLVTVLPAALFIALAYRYDHRGVLSMGLTALASWVGVSVAPLSVLNGNDFLTPGIRLAAVGLGTLLMGAGFHAEHYRRKAHFAFTYLLLGSNLALLALMATLAEAIFDDKFWWGPPAAVLAAALCAGLYWYARRTHSYWFLVLAALYAYGVACYAYGLLALALPGELIVLVGMGFFPASAVAIILFFVNIKKICTPPMPLKAYNPAWPRHLAVRAMAARWHRQLLLSADQLTAIDAAHPLDFYRPAWPLRVGLFLFTCLAISMGSGFVFSWFAFIINFDNVPVTALGLVFFGACGGVLEYSIREKKNFRSGVDNALLYAALGSGISLLFYLTDKIAAPAYPENVLTSTWLLLPLILTLALLLAAVLRYADAVAAAAAVATYFMLTINLTLHTTPGRALLPFVLMLAAASLYALQRRLSQRKDSDYYQTALNTAKALALTLFYLGGNYLVVREGNAALNDLAISQQVPFAPLFYAFTAGIPLTYIAFGLRHHDRLLLLLGLITLAFSLFTLRHYHSLLAPELAAIIGGAVLIIGAGAALRYLRPARHGLTSADDDEPRYFNLENLVTAQTATVPGAPAQGFSFGGGQSGGGGATGAFEHTSP